jgi:hypothetical protein
MNVYLLNSNDLYGLPPEKYDKRGPLWKVETVYLACARQIHIGNYFKRFAKMKAQDIENATALLDEANDRFSRSLDRFVNLQKEIADASKKASADIRKATDSLAQGLARLEKVTNFNQLAALQLAGKLEKIAEAA